jgi:hypothetical protein
VSSRVEVVRMQRDDCSIYEVFLSIYTVGVRGVTLAYTQNGMVK